MSRELYYSLDNIFILHGAFKALERLLGWIMDIQCLTIAIVFELIYT